MTIFSDLREYVAMPAVTSLTLSPDGNWLATTVQSPGPDGKKQVASIWRIDTGHAPPVRLTSSANGESGPSFLPDGSLLFVSKRQRPAAAASDGESDGDEPALWLLPAAGGEASRVAAPPGGVSGLAVARQAATFLLAAAAFSGTTSASEDAAVRKARKDAGVTAILHEGGPIRHWDHDLGPDAPRLLAGEITGSADPAGNAVTLSDVTGDPGRSLVEQSFGLSPDGSLAVSGWRVFGTDGDFRSEIVAIDVATSKRRTLLTAADADFDGPVVSPDGRLVVAIRVQHDTCERPGDHTLVVADSGGDPGVPRDLLAGFDRRPMSPVWAPDSAAVYFTADDNGRRPVFKVELHSGAVSQITTDDAAYEWVCPAPDGLTLYALRSSISEPPTPVRVDLAGPAAGPVRLASPAEQVAVPGHVEELTATAADGALIRAWIVLPAQASAQSPAPLLLWVHGGPELSWNSWSWRWNPWLMAARGYAVLLPDPALSTGYGQDFIARGHGTWGGKPYTDVMTITDAAAGRPDIDASRTAMMGASFGGYMANWIAGHTDRFAAIVSHAGIWALDQMFGTTDVPNHWRRSFGEPATNPARYLDNSPHLHAASIATPMLVIHGDKDYRVPIGEALRLYWELTSRNKAAKFLYFSGENHWIQRPGDVRVWYETVFAFLASYLLGEPWQRPDLV